MVMKKTRPSFKEEIKLWNNGIDYVIGIDEVGRGAFAGPIVGAGVVFKPNFDHLFLRNVNDSKLLRPNQRELCSVFIKQNALHWTVELIDIGYINKYGIGKANIAVFRKVLRSLLLKFDANKDYFVLIDGFHGKYLPGGIQKQKAIVKGDRKSLSIASASIIAKVYRDQLMKEISNKYPNYNFGQNKGYGTKLHRGAIKEHGISKFHRLSFID